MTDLGPAGLRAALAALALAGCGRPIMTVGYQLASTTDYGNGQGVSIGFADWGHGEAEYALLVLKDGTRLHTVGSCGLSDFDYQDGEGARPAWSMGGMLQFHSGGGWGYGWRTGIGMRFEGDRVHASLFVEGAAWIGSDGSDFAVGAEARAKATAYFVF